MTTSTDHDVNVKVKTTGAESVAEIAKQGKKLHTQTAGFTRKEGTEQRKAEKLELAAIKRRKKEGPQELRDLRARNKEFLHENNIRKEKAKLLANEERKRRSTFGGGFRGGLKDRLLPRMPKNAGEAGGMLGSAVGGALSGLLKGITGAAIAGITKLLSMPFQAIGQEYEAYRQHSLSLTKLAGYGGGGASVADVDALRKGAGQALGYMPDEVVNAMALTARATGSSRGTEGALSFSRLTGQDVGETTSQFGTLRQAGNTGFQAGGDAYKQYTKAVAAGITTGLEKARLPEFLSGVMTLTSRAAGREGGDVSSANFTQLLATLGATGESGLQGARGASVASALEEGFSNPGGGEEGMMLAMMGAGFGKDTSYYDAKKRLQAGTHGDPNFIRDQIQNVNAVNGGAGEQANLDIEAMLGGRLTLAQIESVQKSIAAGEDPAAINARIEEMTETETDVLKDIRNLLGGGNEDMLHAARLQSEIANENVTNGKELAKAIEDMQAVLREFVTDALPAVKDVLESLAAFATDMRPVLHDLSNTMNRLAHWLTGRTAEGDLTAGGARRAKDRGVGDPALGVTAAEDADADRISAATGGGVAHDTAILARELGDARQQMEAEAADDVADVRGVTIPSGGHTGGDLAVTETENRVLQLMDRLARDRGFTGLNETPTDTRLELSAMYAWLHTHQMPISSARAVIDRTGGT